MERRFRGSFELERRGQRTSTGSPHAGDTTRYDVIMTGLLEQVLRRLEGLSPDEQDAIASQIIETLDDEKAWADRFGTIPSTLRDMAREAAEEHRRGETRPIDELIQ